MKIIKLQPKHDKFGEWECSLVKIKGKWIMKETISGMVHYEKIVDCKIKLNKILLIRCFLGESS